MKTHASFLTVAIAFVLVVTGYEVAVNGRAIGASLVPFVTTACSSTGPCIGGANSSSGAGVSASSANGRGLYAMTKHVSTTAAMATYGVLGQDASGSGSFNSGVEGLSVRGTGVNGVSTSGLGVNGVSTNNIAVNGTSTNYTAINGTSTHGAGVIGSGSYGMEAFGSAGGGIYTSTSGGNAITATTYGTSVWALVAQSSNGSGVQVTGGSRGIDSTGGYIGVVGRSPQFPFAAADSNGNIVFYVDTSGNLYTKGTVSSASAIRNAVTSYARTTAPAIEDTGTAHLAYGVATVHLSPSFAREIDPRYGYQVFLTPGGDTRGLYVVGKYARGFTVREVQGGRGSFNFDYHVYAHTQAPEVRQPVQSLPLPTRVQAPPEQGRP